MKGKSLSRVRLFATPWTAAHQAPLSMGFARQEYWSGLLFPSPGDLSNPGMEPMSPVSLALAGRFFTTESPGKPSYIHTHTHTHTHTYTYVYMCHIYTYVSYIYTHIYMCLCVEREKEDEYRYSTLTKP